MSVLSKRRKCLACKEFFYPDAHNHKHQRYCLKPACRRASKRASQQRWLRRPDSRNYFHDEENVKRVRAWREAHPGYWKRSSRRSKGPQVVAPQSVNPVGTSCNVPAPCPRTLQDLAGVENWDRHPAFIGLIALVTGRTLQEDVVSTARRVVEQGRNILGLIPQSDLT